MKSLGNAVRRAVLAAAMLALPVVVATVPATVSTITSEPTCCTGTPWGEIAEPPV